MLIPSSSVNITPKLRIFILTGFLRFFRRFPQINVGGDSAHLSSFGKRTREPRPRMPAKGHVATKWNMAGTKKSGQMTFEAAKEIAERILSDYHLLVVNFFNNCWMIKPNLFNLLTI